MTTESPVSKLLRKRVAINRRLNNDTYAAYALGAATVIALVWANIGSSYEAVRSAADGPETSITAVSLAGQVLGFFVRPRPSVSTE